MSLTELELKLLQAEKTAQLLTVQLRQLEREAVQLFLERVRHRQQLFPGEPLLQRTVVAKAYPMCNKLYKEIYEKNL